MRNLDSHSFDLEDGFEGAVDIVFLLLIFFFVASSFDRTVIEKLVLPTRDADRSVAVVRDERKRLDITIYEDSRITIDHREVVIEDPNSVEAYRSVGDAIEAWIGEKMPETAFERAVDRVDVFVTTDRKSYAGAALNVIMACLDRGITPQVIFEESQAPSR